MATKKFLIAKFDCTYFWNGRYHNNQIAVGQQIQKNVKYDW